METENIMTAEAQTEQQSNSTQPLWLTAWEGEAVYEYDNVLDVPLLETTGNARVNCIGR